jgi:hypothetical protein
VLAANLVHRLVERIYPKLGLLATLLPLVNCLLADAQAAV